VGWSALEMTGLSLILILYLALGGAIYNSIESENLGGLHQVGLLVFLFFWLFTFWDSLSVLGVWATVVSAFFSWLAGAYFRHRLRERAVRRQPGVGS
jgi:hypothetical protein